jgi:hypothetical protein
MLMLTLGQGHPDHPNRNDVQSEYLRGARRVIQSHLFPRTRKPPPIALQVPPLFERLIYYILIPDLAARIVFELLLGVYFYDLTQPKQWMFYGIVAIEYVFQSRVIVQDNFRKDSNLIVSGLMLVMILHGIFVGLAWRNSLLRILIDTVPLTVVALNVLLLNRWAAFVGFDFDRLNRVNLIYAVAMVIVGVVAVAIKRPSIVSLGSPAASSVSLTILLSSFMVKRVFSFKDLAVAAIILVPIAPNLNRTTLVVVAICLVGLFFSKIIVNGKRLYLSLVAMFLVAAVVPLTLPEDSRLVRRLQATLEYNPEQTQGSIGERQAEWIAINDKLHRMGEAAEWFGAGSGASYEVQFTQKLMTNYSHAHFSWSLFRLRFGYIGYAYLLIFAILILHSIVRGYRSSSLPDRISMTLGIWSFVYLFTYVVANFFVAGLQFAYSGALTTRRPVERWGYAPADGARRVPAS